MIEIRGPLFLIYKLQCKGQGILHRFDTTLSNILMKQDNFILF